jgi:hypothetical protein
LSLAVLIGGACYWLAWNRHNQPDASGADIKMALGQSRLPFATSSLRFETIGPESGLNFTYFGSPTQRLHMFEQNGGGVAMIDFDGDDRLDLFFSNGSDPAEPAESQGASSRLFRATGPLRYEDVTAAAGLESFGFGMGCAVGDYDGDGFADLFQAGYGGNRLWHNNGDGTLTDVTEAAGLASSLWSTSAAFADLDGDGHLDLYVTTYVDYPADHPPCYLKTDRGVLQVTCDPSGLPAQPDLLYRNLGNGSFEEVSRSSGVGLAPDGKGLDVAIADLDDDGRLDIYVANDTTRNFLFHNLGGMRFEEVGVSQGVALSADGRTQGSMGIGCADSNGDGMLDLCVANFEREVNDFYENMGDAGFAAVNGRLGLDAVSRPMLGFGVALYDFDLDHYPDLFVANGHIWDTTSWGVGYEYEMRPTLMANNRGRRFVEVTTQAGDYFQHAWLGRATAVGDLDNDGDYDLVVAHLKKPAAILRNDSSHAGQAVRLRLVGTRSSRDALGARIRWTVGGRRWTIHVPSGGGFQGSSDQRVLLAVDRQAQIEELLVRWPNGSEERWANLPVAHAG